MAQNLKGFCLTELKVSTELFMPQFFSLFPLHGSVPVSSGSDVFCSTALCSSDTKLDFPVKHQDCVWLSSVKVISGFGLVLLKAFLSSKISQQWQASVLSVKCSQRAALPQCHMFGFKSAHQSTCSWSDFFCGDINWRLSWPWTVIVRGHKKFLGLL